MGFPMRSSDRWASLSRHLSDSYRQRETLAVLNGIESVLQHNGRMHSLFRGGDADYFTSRPHAGVFVVFGTGYLIPTIC